MLLQNYFAQKEEETYLLIFQIYIVIFQFYLLLHILCKIRQMPLRLTRFCRESHKNRFILFHSVPPVSSFFFSISYYNFPFDPGSDRVAIAREEETATGKGDGAPARRAPGLWCLRVIARPAVFLPSRGSVLHQAKVTRSHGATNGGAGGEKGISEQNGATVTVANLSLLQQLQREEV